MENGDAGVTHLFEMSDPWLPGIGDWRFGWGLISRLFLHALQKFLLESEIESESSAGRFSEDVLGEVNL